MTLPIRSDSQELPPLNLQMDLPSLEKYLLPFIPDFGHLVSATKFTGGQSNPTFALETSTGKYVLRRKPPGTLLASTHAVDREFRVMQALANSDVPVPKMLHLCADDSVIGSMFYVMGFIEGRNWWDQTLPRETNDTRTAVFDEMNRVMAALHSVDVDAVGLGDFGRRGGYFIRQVKRWNNLYTASETETNIEIDQLIAWLQENIPVEEGSTVLVHGDFRLDNMIFHPSSPTVVALLDWELSTLGHPLADLAYQCMQWRLAPGRLTRGLVGSNRKTLGIPTEQEYVESYCQRRGLTEITDWTFAVAFSFFRLAAIIQGIKKRALTGNASSTRAMELAKMVAPLGRMAIEMIEETV